MAVTSEKLEMAVEAALISLTGVAATGTNEEKIAASKALIDAVQVASTQVRKEMITSRVLPLIDAVTKNLSGQLVEGVDEFAPVYGLDIAQQGSLLMSITKEIS